MPTARCSLFSLHGSAALRPQPVVSRPPLLVLRLTLMEKLPVFTYHPDPVATGVVTPSSAECVCCGRSRGYLYVGPVYAISDLHEKLCPWCIADGSAAAKLDASFADSHPLIQAGLKRAIVDEVNLRTPGYVSWQQESWLSHCDDACEFHGDASARDVAGATPETKSDWLVRYRQDEKGWAWATEGYEPGGGSALYKFVCRHCRQVVLGWDLC